MKKRGILLLLLVLTVLLLPLLAFAECSLSWESNPNRHRQYCNGCEKHSGKTEITAWEAHSYHHLQGCIWPEQVDRVNGQMPNSVTVKWDLNNSGRVCSVCGYVDKLVPDAEYDEASKGQSTPETCTSAGSYTYQTAGFTWSDMKLRAQKTYTVKALGHDWSAKNGTCARRGCGATCDHAEAKKRLTCLGGTDCSVCGKTLSPLGHDWSNKDGTCARAGCGATCDHAESQKRVTCTAGTDCSVCGKALSPLGHDWSNKDGVCARAGCGEACDHAEAQKRMTCTAGTDCDVCGKALSPLGHDWSNKDGVCARAGCGEVCDHAEAQKRVTCTAGTDCDVCGTTLKPQGHGYQAEIVKPTCTEDGYTLLTCIRCGDTYTADVVKKLSHWYGEWSPSANGVHSAACKRSGCRYTAKSACQSFAYMLPAAQPSAITLCPVCGKNDADVQLALVNAEAKAVTKCLPDGELVLRMGETLLSVGFELGGSLTQPEGQIEITLPAALLNGSALSLLNPGGTETAIPVSANGEDASFTLDFEVQTETPALLLRLVPAA